MRWPSACSSADHNCAPAAPGSLDPPVLDERRFGATRLPHPATSRAPHGDESGDEPTINHPSTNHQPTTSLRSGTARAHRYFFTRRSDVTSGRRGAPRKLLGNFLAVDMQEGKPESGNFPTCNGRVSRPARALAAAKPRQATARRKKRGKAAHPTHHEGIQGILFRPTSTEWDWLRPRKPRASGEATMHDRMSEL